MHVYVCLQHEILKLDWIKLDSNFPYEFSCFLKKGHKNFIIYLEEYPFQINVIKSRFDFSGQLLRKTFVDNCVRFIIYKDTKMTLLPLMTLMS